MGAIRATTTMLTMLIRQVETCTTIKQARTGTIMSLITLIMVLSTTTIQVAVVVEIKKISCIYVHVSILDLTLVEVLQPLVLVLVLE